MKIIISHDVDHITFWEHNNDLMIPKFIVRGFIELGMGYISTSEIGFRFNSIIQNKWHNLEKLLQFNRKNSVPSTFFIGVSKGKGLNYTLKDAAFWIKKILKEGFDVGVHGIAFDNFNDIKNEYNVFKDISGLEQFGIRMHYLRNSKNTLQFLNDAGYTFDSTLHRFKNPFSIGELWEFPSHIMDVYVIRKNSSWQNQNLKQSKETTKRMLEDNYNKGINYLTIIFHDRFFSDCFKTWKDWYIWLIEYLHDNKLDFISYHEAINELEMPFEKRNANPV